MALKYTLALSTHVWIRLPSKHFILKVDIVLTNQVQSKHLIFECANI